MNELRSFTDAAQLDGALADYISAHLGHDLDRHGRASLAVSGGGTPKHMFQQLSLRELDWSRVWVTLVDERWVAPDSADSNERLVRENLLQNRAAAANFVSLKTAHADAADALEEVERLLDDIPQPFSLVLLGMGGDGHTASWFPQAKNLRDLLDPFCSARLGITNPVTAPHQRITLTLPAVLNSRDIIIHITGKDKHRVLGSARQHHYPVATILTQTTTPVTIWWAP